MFSMLLAFLLLWRPWSPGVVDVPAGAYVPSAAGVLDAGVLAIASFPVDPGILILSGVFTLYIMYLVHCIMNDTY